MPTDIEPTEAFQRSVVKLSDALSDFRDATDFLDVPLRARLRELLLASGDFNRQLPAALVLGAAKFWQDPDDGVAYDSRDYEAVGENGGLCAMYVLMDLHQLMKTDSLADMHRRLDRLGDDLSDLASWCPAYDVEYGTWNLV